MGPLSIVGIFLFQKMQCNLTNQGGFDETTNNGGGLDFRPQTIDQVPDR